MFFPFVHYDQTHSLMGAFTICLPLGLLLFLLFEIVMRRPLVGLSPAWFQQRLEARPQIPREARIAPHLVFTTKAAAAVVIGALTHQIWDAFTHQGGWGTALIPSLNSVYSILDFSVPGYKLFQYGSTFVGLPLLAALAMVSLHRAAPRQVEVSAISVRWRVFFVSSASLIFLAVGLYAIATQSTWPRVLGLTIRLSGAILAVFCVVCCGLFHALTCRSWRGVRGSRLPGGPSGRRAP